MRPHALLGLILVLCLLCLSHCQLQWSNSDEDQGNEEDSWNLGVFTPQPLKPAPWAALPTPPATPPPPTPSAWEPQRPAVQTQWQPQPAMQRPSPPPQHQSSSSGLQVPGLGQVDGLRGYKTIRNRPIDAYLGLRYGQLTSSGLGRFLPANPTQYQGYIDAKRPSENCPQFPELQRLREAEQRGENVNDCLTLNIYVPSGGRNLPVMVFVHGEMMFDGGAEEAQPDYFLEHNVVLVSINYRLAPFGFLAALTDELPGNVALSDIKLALEFVQRNIHYFGGSPGQVTLFGQAAGATLAHALSLSGKAKGLFHKLILQSGTALNPYFLDERPLATLSTFSRLARCPMTGSNLSPLIQCLGTQSTSNLVGAFQQLWEQNEPRGNSFTGGFKLVVGDAMGYLPQHPAALVANNSVPVIMGAAKDAGAFILSRFYNEIANLQSNNLSDYINIVLRHTAPPQHHSSWRNLAFREIFSPEEQRYPNARTVTKGLLELSNLILYRAPVIDSIRFTYKKYPTYVFAFDYRGKHHRFGFLDNPLPWGVDATLSDDSIYLFPYPEEVRDLNPEDKSLSRAFVTMWVNFAQTGVPNPNPGIWPNVSSEYGPFLRFTNSEASTLELDQHFGEGINIPNLYSQYFNAMTTTTTTRRPYYTYPNYTQVQANRSPNQGTPNAPETPPRQPTVYEQYARAQDHYRQHQLREQQQREELLRDQQLRSRQEQEQQRQEQQRQEQQQQPSEERPQEQRTDPERNQQYYQNHRYNPYLNNDRNNHPQRAKLMNRRQRQRV